VGYIPFRLANMIGWTTRKGLNLSAEGCNLLLERMEVTAVSLTLLLLSPYERGTYFLEMFVLLIASNPIHSTLALSQAVQAGNFPSHFCFLCLHLVQDEMARATLYCCSGFSPFPLLAAEAGRWCKSGAANE